jgi:putative addiction module component (TIGR02574 family)
VVPPIFLRFRRFGCIHRRETCGEVLAVDPLVAILAVVPWTSYNSIMKRDATALLKEALALPVKDRAAIAEALLASLDEHCGDDAESAWKTEIERRITELDAGCRQFRGQKYGSVSSNGRGVVLSNDFAQAWISSGRRWVRETIFTAGRPIPSRTRTTQSCPSVSRYELSDHVDLRRRGLECADVLG